MLWRLFQTGVVRAEPNREEADAGDVFLFVLLCEDLGVWVQLDDPGSWMSEEFGMWVCGVWVWVPQGK